MEIEYDGCDEYQVIYATIPKDYVLTTDDFNKLQMLPPHDLISIIVIRGEDHELPLVEFAAVYCNAAQKARIKYIITTYRDLLTNMINEI